MTREEMSDLLDDEKFAKKLEEALARQREYFAQRGATKMGLWIGSMVLVSLVGLFGSPFAGLLMQTEMFALSMGMLAILGVICIASSVGVALFFHKQDSYAPVWTPVLGTWGGAMFFAGLWPSLVSVFS